MGTLRAALYYVTDAPYGVPPPPAEDETDDPAPMTQQSRPVYLRLRDQIAAAIIDGDYAEGEMLPSVRAFAAEQGANPLTVAKAYQQFQTDGLVEVQRGVGMYVVAGAAERLRRNERAQFLTEEWPELRARMNRLGIDPAELLERG
ncbi:GntR family transcriptional regulator [Pelagerythrobacter marensis]|uniref:GntR family transcriptional regulator n=2 Tax=Pelagerythrobacter marensis TaxID=543877 RepID=A0A0G3X9X5_9SPHN|nr:GntR family transcriptional regulator [Pelagerythrobacter marensis]